VAPFVHNQGRSHRDAARCRLLFGGEQNSAPDASAWICQLSPFRLVCWFHAAHSSRVVIESITALGIEDVIQLPLAGTAVPAGFPSPADDYLEGAIDFNKHLIRNPASTFALRTRGDSMRGVGIFSGDILIVDRAETVNDGSIVIAVVDGGFTVKRLRHRAGKTFLCPENPEFSPIEVTSPDDQIWGVVISSIRNHR